MVARKAFSRHAQHMSFSVRPATGWEVFDMATLERVGPPFDDFNLAVKLGKMLNEGEQEPIMHVAPADANSPAPCCGLIPAENLDAFFAGAAEPTCPGR